MPCGRCARSLLFFAPILRLATALQFRVNSPYVLRTCATLALLVVSLGQVDPKDGKIGILSRSDLLSNIDAGVCGCAIMPLQDLDVYHANAQHCDKTPVGQSIDVLFQGFPVHGDAASALHHVVVNARGTGQLRALMEVNNPLGTVGRWMTKSLAPGATRPERCGTDGEQESDASLSLTPNDLLGSFLLLAFFIGLSLVVHLLQTVASKVAAGGCFDFKKNHPAQVEERRTMPRPRYNSSHILVKGEAVLPPTFHRASASGTDLDPSRGSPRGSVHEVMALLESTAAALQALPESSDSLPDTSLPQAPHQLKKSESQVQKVMERVRSHRKHRKKAPEEASASPAPMEASASPAQSDAHATAEPNRV
jgi:hypothetical protein